MNNKRLIVSISFLSIALIAGYSFAAFKSLGSTFETDSFLSSAKVAKSVDEVALNLIVNELDVDRGVQYVTATPQLSGEQGESTANGSFPRHGQVFSFDVFSGPTLLDVPAGSFVGSQSLGLRLNGTPTNYPFDTYESKIYATASSDYTEDGITKLVLRDMTELVPGFSGTSKYLAFIDESSDKAKIQGDIQQGMGLVQWKFERSNSTVVAAFLLGALMIIGAAVSSLMTLNVLRGRRPPTINALVWFAAFLFALFQVRNQLPGDPPNGVRFDLFVFYPVVLLLIILIAINVQLWNNRDDWDLENPNMALDGKIVKVAKPE